MSLWLIENMWCVVVKRTSTDLKIGAIGLRVDHLSPIQPQSVYA